MRRFFDRHPGFPFVSPALFLIAAQIVSGQTRQPQGVPARSAPTDYAAHVEVGGVNYAASLLSADEVKHSFAFDISKTYVVFEVAVYPATTQKAPASLDPEGFVVQTSASGDVAHRADSVTVASVIQQKNLPPLPSSPKPAVAVSTEVGYESGRDPYTGQRVHGTYTDTQVAVGKDNRPPNYPQPGGYPQDRELLEAQLWEKSLPEGKLTRPAAGYLYFPASLLKKRPGGIYRLEYLGSADQEAAGSAPLEKAELQIPSKKH